jgi:type VI secretion system secreted protein VgrG
VGQDLQEKVGAKYGLDAGQEVHIKAGMNVVIEAGISITLKAGGGFIVVGPAGVTISGAPVLINSGGAAGSGSGSTPQPPTAPLEADKAEPGQAVETPPKKRPPKPAVYSPAALVMRQAAQDGTPFCEVCARGGQ